MLAQSIENIRNFVDRSYVSYHVKQNRKANFNPHLDLSVDTAHYLVKTADSRAEFEEVLRLRYEIFMKEGLNKNNPVRIDIDRYDFICDHLIIIDKRKNKLVGTYRLISNLFSKSFYSENEFALENFFSLPGNKLELGRACIHKDYRNGIVISLLWRGVMNYMERTSSRFLFGCASVKITSVQDILKLCKFVESQEFWTDEYKTGVQKEFKMDFLEFKPLGGQPPVDAAAADLLPPLVQVYVKAGARLAGEPAFDKDFRCIDYLTVLDSERMNKSYERKYRG